jgi:hypothetical protein
MPSPLHCPALACQPAAMLPPAAPCDNVLASHPGVLSVAASDPFDHRTILGPWNSSCIHLWAPGGGLGQAITGAQPSGPDKYDGVLDGWVPCERA